jgi:hypothetical protein
VQGQRATVHEDFTGSLLIHTGKYLDQGGLAGPVLTQQRADLTSIQPEPHPIKGTDPGKILDNVPYLQERVFGRLCRLVVHVLTPHRKTP